MKKAQIKELKRMMENFRNHQGDKRVERINELLAYLAACLDGIKEKV